MTIHSFGSPEAALAYVECVTCTTREKEIDAHRPLSDRDYLRQLDELRSSPDFLFALGTGVAENTMRIEKHERVTLGGHTIVLFQHDRDHHLSREDAAAIKDLGVNPTLVDAYAQ